MKYEYDDEKSFSFGSAAAQREAAPAAPLRTAPFERSHINVPGADLIIQAPKAHLSVYDYDTHYNHRVCKDQLSFPSASLPAYLAGQLPSPVEIQGLPIVSVNENTTALRLVLKYLSIRNSLLSDLEIRGLSPPAHCAACIRDVLSLVKKLELRDVQFVIEHQLK